MVAAPLDDLRRNQNSPLRFQPVDQAERQRLAQQAQEVQRFRQQRQKLETNAAGAPAGTRTKEFAPARVKLPGSPIVAKSGAELGKDHAPPKTYEAPKPDPKVAAKPRVNRSPEQPQQHTVNRVPLDQPRTAASTAAKGRTAAPQPQRQPQVKQPAPQPQRQPQAEQPAPQPQRQPAGRTAGPATSRQVAGGIEAGPTQGQRQELSVALFRRRVTPRKTGDD